MGYARSHRPRGAVFPRTISTEANPRGPGRAPHAALAGRLHVRLHLQAICERERFAALIQHAFKSAGSAHTLISDSGLELLRQASQGLPRQAARILRAAMPIAAGKKLNHLPDDLLQQAITELR